MRWILKYDWAHTRNSWQGLLNSSYVRGISYLIKHVQDIYDKTFLSACMRFLFATLVVLFLTKYKKGFFLLMGLAKMYT